MKKFSIFILLSLLITLASCFEKVSEDTPNNTGSQVDISSNNEDISEENTTDVMTQEDVQIEGEESQTRETLETGSENGVDVDSETSLSSEETQQIVDESVSELEEILTEDIINEIFGDVQ